MIKIKRIAALALSLLVLGCTVTASALQSVPYRGYEFNSEDKSVPAPVGYEAEKTVFDKDIKFSIDFGKAKNIYFDGTDSEAFFSLIQTDSKIIKADSNFNVIAYYNIPESGMFSSIAFNPENGYLFCLKNGAVYVYNTNGAFIKTLSCPDASIQFNPTNIIHALIEEENSFAALSGDSVIVFDGSGEYVSTLKLQGNAADLCYNSSVSTLSYLTGNKIIDYTNDIVYELNTQFSPNARLISGFEEDNYFVLDNGGVFKISATDGTSEKIQMSAAALSICFNAELEKLNVLFPSENLLTEFFNSELSLEKKTQNYNLVLKDASDLYYDENGALYILDGGNGRIVKTDASVENVYEVYESFIKDDKKLSIVGAKGMWFETERMFVADTEHERVLVSDYKGNVLKVLTKPKKLKGLTAPFKASKVLTDKNGRIYCIAETVNLGAFVFSKDYEYQNFFGSNEVLTTAEAIYNFFVKQFLNKEQKAALKSNTPVNLSNFDIDSNDFIYTITKTDQKLVNTKFSGLIRKINYISSDIWDTEENVPYFGDLEEDRESKVTNTNFIDVDISKEGWVNALDSARGKVFQYSSDGQLISVFGGIGAQNGMSNSPVAIETVGEKIYVLDSYNKSIIVYKPTEYVTTLHDAFLNTESASLKDAVSKWNKVLSYNSNNSYAYYGLGVAYENAGKYKEAMDNYKLADAKEQYSKAFKEYRKAYVNDHMAVIGIILISVIAVVVICVKKLSKLFIVPENCAYSPIESKRGMPLYVLFHPADGFAQFKARKIYSVLTAGLIVAAFFVIRILEFFKTGFIFNANKPINYNLFATLLGTVLIYLLFIFSNLAISSFLDGKGNLKEIASLTSYSMIPFLFVTLLNIGLSNILLLDEKVFMNILLVVAVGWSLLLLIVGSMQIHEYSFGKTIVSLLLSILTMVVFAVLGLLFFSLFQELLDFIKAVFYEISLR